MKKRGFATYLSWGSKVVAALFTIYAAIWLPERSGTDIILIAGGIMGPFLPIDVSKVKAVIKPTSEVGK